MQYAAKFKGYTSQIQLNVCFCFPSPESFVDFGIVGSLWGEDAQELGEVGGWQGVLITLGLENEKMSFPA